MDEKTSIHIFNNISVSKNEFIEAQDTINKYVNNLNKRNKSLIETLNTYNKDEEIQKLQEEINIFRNNSLYIMSESEELLYKEFSNEHYKTCKGNTKYIITPTGIGSALELICTKCNKVKNITDYSNW